MFENKWNYNFNLNNLFFLSLQTININLRKHFLEPEGIDSASAPLRATVAVGSAQMLGILARGIKGVASIVALPDGDPGVEVQVESLPGAATAAAVQLKLAAHSGHGHVAKIGGILFSDVQNKNLFSIIFYQKKTYRQGLRLQIDRSLRFRIRISQSTGGEANTGQAKKQNSGRGMHFAWIWLCQLNVAGIAMRALL